MRYRFVFNLLLLAFAFGWVWVMFWVIDHGGEHPGWELIPVVLLYVFFPKEWVAEKISRSRGCIRSGGGRATRPRAEPSCDAPIARRWTRAAFSRARTC